jgi:hypothetical protein
LNNLDGRVFRNEGRKNVCNRFSYITSLTITTRPPKEITAKSFPNYSKKEKEEEEETNKASVKDGK